MPALELEPASRSRPGLSGLPPAASSTRSDAYRPCGRWPGRADADDQADGSDRRPEDRSEARRAALDPDVADRREQHPTAFARAHLLFIVAAGTTSAPPHGPCNRDHGHPVALDRVAVDRGRAGPPTDPLDEALDQAGRLARCSVDSVRRDGLHDRGLRSGRKSQASGSTSIVVPVRKRPRYRR